MRTKIGWLGLVIVGLVAGSLVASGMVRADDAPAKKHHRHHRIHGKVTAFDSTSVTIEVRHHKKGETASTESKTFQITDKTKVEKIEKDGSKTTGTLKVGKHVSISADKDVAIEITIGHHRHHKKPAAA